MKRILDVVKKNKWLIIIICTIFTIAPICVYFWTFRSYSISDDPNDWGVFGDYIGGIYGGFFTCLITILAIYLARALTKRDLRQFKTSAAAEKLYKQICVIENNGYNLNSINKLLRDIKECELYFPDKEFIEQLGRLYDQFVEQNGGTGTVDEELKNYIITQLKVYYEQ